MNYCADTWFMLELTENTPKAHQIFNEVRERKSRIIIPAVVVAETVKQLLHRGRTQTAVEAFFSSVEQSDKIRIIAVDKPVAVEAGKISLSYGAPLVDSIVAATAHLYNCDVLLGKDAHYTPLIKKKYIKLHNW